MKLPRRPARVPQALPSERGFLEIAGRDDGISLRETFLRFRDLVSADMDWADSRKLRFRLRAAWAKVGALALTAASTVVLGIPAIPGRAAIALPMVALVALISALEPFFNWRARWVLMEETQYRLNRIRDEMDYYLVTMPTADLDRDRLHGFFTDQQDIWQDVSRQWIEFRKQDQSQPGGTPPLDASARLQPDERPSSTAESDEDPPLSAAACGWQNRPRSAQSCSIWACPKRLRTPGHADERMSANIDDSAQNQDHHKREDNPEQGGDAPDEMRCSPPSSSRTATVSHATVA